MFERSFSHQTRQEKPSRGLRRSFSLKEPSYRHRERTLSQEPHKPPIRPPKLPNIPKLINEVLSRLPIMGGLFRHSGSRTRLGSASSRCTTPSAGCPSPTPTDEETSCVPRTPETLNYIEDLVARGFPIIPFPDPTHVLVEKQRLETKNIIR